jgi:DNA primase
MKKLLKILSEYNEAPELLSSGQIRLHCPFKHLHSIDSRKRKQMFFTPAINAYHCFSCGSKGRLTKLLTEHYGVPFYEAVEMVHIEQYEKLKKDSVEKDYYWELKLPEVFEKRGFKKELIVDKFRVGVGEGNVTILPNYWDGILKGIIYRIDTERGKKVWSSEGFDKEHYIYNGDARYTDYVIIVEGHADVWRLLSWGFNAYGILGTEMSSWQAEHICKTPLVYIASDMDVAGIRAAEKWYKLLYKDTECLFLDYPAKDPDTCTYRNFRYAFKNPRSYAEFRLSVIDFL